MPKHLLRVFAIAVTLTGIAALAPLQSLEDSPGPLASVSDVASELTEAIGLGTDEASAAGRYWFSYRANTYADCTLNKPYHPFRLYYWKMSRWPGNHLWAKCTYIGYHNRWPGGIIVHKTPNWTNACRYDQPRGTTLRVSVRPDRTVWCNIYR